MKKFILILLLIPVYCIAQNNKTDSVIHFIALGEHKKAVNYTIKHKLESTPIAHIAKIKANNIGHNYNIKNELIKKNYLKDTGNFYYQLAYAYLLENKIKNSVSNKEKAKLLIEQKKALNYAVLNSDNKLLDDVYNLLAVWHRITAQYTDMELEAMELFYGGAPKGGSFDKALTYHQKAFNTNPRLLFKYELALTYEAMKDEEMYEMTLIEIKQNKPISEEDMFFLNL